MANTIDPHDRAAIETLAASGQWERAGLIEALRLQELLKRQQALDTLRELVPDYPQTVPPSELLLDSPELTEVERELTGDILTLFDEQSLNREQALSLLGQVSALIELVKRGQAQKPTKDIS